jgi:hypothetical protein
MMAALIAETQTYPVFMLCRAVVIGAHHVCWLLTTFSYIDHFKKLNSELVSDKRVSL